jgi:hypothetical protein
MRKTLSVVGIILIAILLILGACAPAPTHEPTPALTTIKITAAKLYADYDANEVAADLKYKSELLEVTGVVTDIGISQSIRPGTPVIVLAESLDAPFMEGVTIHLSIDQKVKVATLSKGDTVTVMGICEGVALVRGTEEFGLRGVRLKDSSIVE